MSFKYLIRLWYFLKECQEQKKKVFLVNHWYKVKKVAFATEQLFHGVTVEKYWKRLQNKEFIWNVIKTACSWSVVDFLHEVTRNFRSLIDSSFGQIRSKFANILSFKRNGLTAFIQLSFIHKYLLMFLCFRKFWELLKVLSVILLEFRLKRNSSSFQESHLNFGSARY